MNKNEDKKLTKFAGSKSLPAFVTVVSSAFRELSQKISALGNFEKSLLKELLVKLENLDSETSKISQEFDKINKQHLSEEEQSKLWELDNSVNHLRTNLLEEEIQYKIQTRPTIASNSQKVVDVLNEMDTLLRDWIEISDGLRASIRNKIESIVMQKGIESSQKLLNSSKKLEKSSNLLLIVTIALLILWIISAVFG